MTIRFHKNDLPDLSRYDVDAVAIDTETLGLNPHRDRLCVVQLSPGDGTADVVQIAPGQREAPNLVTLLRNPAITKLFHYGRFDIAVLYNAFGAMAEPVFCTKIASRLTRTYTDRHGLKDICSELLGINLSKVRAILGLGGRDADAGTARICRIRRSSSSQASRCAVIKAGAGEPCRSCRCLLPLPARQGGTRSARLGRRGHLRS